MGSLLGALDVNNFWQLLDKMAREVPLEAPWNAPCALEWDKMTVKQLIEQKCWTRWEKLKILISYILIAYIIVDIIGAIFVFFNLFYHAFPQEWQFKARNHFLNWTLLCLFRTLNKQTNIENRTEILLKKSQVMRDWPASYLQSTEESKFGQLTHR